ncbi:ketopantoate reductase family protein [Paracoccus alkanivorans]|uniref:Ketopantoate reductase N-terminal domain-containing protein n=1 Tax=Paracoccus alkanivorans TaxID=2116655 RepID=A0A3M0MBW9_9RHOB|nr:hypothetical protein [Paracoccus alkanivorans]RMC35252.1 hypothetical protein C9E81_08300 [Paracoccus alkanivorans]
MAYKILILGASYGSLLGTKLAMAGHEVDLVCRSATAKLINEKGAEVRIQLRGEDAHRAIRSVDLPGRVGAVTPGQVTPAEYDMIALAMQEPQYGAPGVRPLMTDIAHSGRPCLSIMNMPPLPFLRRMKGIDHAMLEDAYSAPRVWDGFEPGLMSLCSPDPQAFRPPDEEANILHVGLPTNFKAAAFADDAHTRMLRQMEDDIAAVTFDGKDVPVKLRVFDSLFVPLAKWSMLLTGNYRCITPGDAQAIREAVHADMEKSRAIYGHVDAVARKLGADSADQVPFEKYAKAAEGLLKPSSAARAVYGGATEIERVDKIVQKLGEAVGMPSADIDDIVAVVDARLAQNVKKSA